MHGATLKSKDFCYISKAEFSVLITLLPLPILYTNIQFIRYREYNMLPLERTGECGSGAGFFSEFFSFPIHIISPVFLTRLTYMLLLPEQKGESWEPW